jgi:hypothetical protein
MSKRWKRAALALAAACLASPTSAQTMNGRVRAVGAEVVLEWNAVTMTTVTGQNGVEQVRLAAIAHVAMFEAVNSIVGEFKPYLTEIDAPAGASAEAAAAAAAHAALTALVPEQKNALDAALAETLARIPDGPARVAGIQVGEAAATATVLSRHDDGSLPLAFYAPVSNDAGQWQTTPTCPAVGGLFLHWRNLKPFGIRRGDQFRSDPPPRLNGRRFARDYNEVRVRGGLDSDDRPEDRANVARFYAVVQSQHIWNPIARQIAAARRISISDAARVFALINMAMNDALIAVMETKYHYTFWRPETAISSAIDDGNPETTPDPGFTPFLPTPCHPSYPSAHAASSFAAREILERIFGMGGHFIKLSTAALPGVELRYTRLNQVTRDINDARIYGGMHYRFDQQAGARQGRRVGAYVIEHNLRRAKQNRVGEKQR